MVFAILAYELALRVIIPILPNELTAPMVLPVLA
jgi:hypothetical protein